MAERTRILVVEDDDDLRRLLSLSLGRLASVAAASDGEEALAWLRRSDAPDVIVSDVMMPRVSGLELAHALKHDERLCSIPLLLLSAATDAKAMVAGINAGARHYLSKPFKFGDLEGRVKKLLALRAGERVGPPSPRSPPSAHAEPIDDMPFDLEIEVTMLEHASP